MSPPTKEPRRLAPVWRAVLEISFIVFLFYANLLMGDFTSTNGKGRSLVFALRDIVTPINSVIAITAAIIGYLGFDYLRRKL